MAIYIASGQEQGVSHIFYGNLVQSIFKFKISMAFTLYKLSKRVKRMMYALNHQVFDIPTLRFIEHLMI